MKRVGIVLGTRPEIIKFAPVIRALQSSTTLAPLVIFTGQHREMGKQAFLPFGITPDIDLALMEDGQTPNSFLGKLLPALEKIFAIEALSGVLVQGDTTTALGGALAAFHSRIPIGHVEAGLRTNRLDSPFPEEMNRSVISKIADIHFAPTERNREALEKEGVTKGVEVVGNTVVDALFWITSLLDEGRLHPESSVKTLGLQKKRFVFVTGHRRENFDQPLKNLCLVLLQLRDQISDLEVLYPVHLNPNVFSVVTKMLSNQPRIHLVSPLDYPSTVYAMRYASLIISDSGGIQEEAPSLGTHVLVTRNTTERREALDAGCATLCPLENSEKFFAVAKQRLDSLPLKKESLVNPFGDGQTSKRIVSLLEAAWK